MSTPQTIVVAIDFSETSIDALQFACDAARHQNAGLHIVHVVPDPTMEAWSVKAAGIDWHALTQDNVAKAEKQLEMVPLYGLPPECVTRVVVMGAPDFEICRYAAQQKADLLVLGTHGYGPVRHFLIGSVVAKVLRNAPCPVVTVPHGTLRKEAAAPTVV